MICDKPLQKTFTNHLGVDRLISGNRCTNRNTTMLDQACNVVSAQRNQELNDMYPAIDTINQEEVIDISEAQNLINTPTVVTSSHNNKNIKNVQFPRDLYKVQKEAIDAIFTELCTLDKNRATVSMAPRLGKTAVMTYHIANS